MPGKGWHAIPTVRSLQRGPLKDRMFALVSEGSTYPSGCLHGQLGLNPMGQPHMGWGWGCLRFSLFIFTKHYMPTIEWWIWSLHKHEVGLIAFIFPKNIWASLCLTNQNISDFPLEASLLPKMLGLTWSKMEQSDFCLREVFILESLLQLLPSLSMSHVRAGGTRLSAWLLGESYPHHLPPELSTSHHSFIRQKALSSQDGPQSRALNMGIQGHRPCHSLSCLPHTSAIRVPAAPEDWCSLILQSQNHCLSFIPMDSMLVALECILLNPQNQCGGDPRWQSW